MRTNSILNQWLAFRSSVILIFMVIEGNPKWVATEGHPYSRGAPLCLPTAGRGSQKKKGLNQ